MNAREMLEQPRDLYLTVGFEPDMDSADPHLTGRVLGDAKLIAMTSYLSPWLLEHADILLPIATFAETSGTFVNIEGSVQSFKGVSAAPGETRPAWKVLRVLGNLVDVDGFDYADSHQVRDEVLAACEGLVPDNSTDGVPQDKKLRCDAASWERVGGIPIHAVDALARRAHALQVTPDAWGAAVRVNAAAAASLGVNGADALLRVTQGDASGEFAVAIDDGVPDGCIWLPLAIPGADALGPAFGPVGVEKV
jgi:NADH-quinone oxidoreductase subunit G